MAFERIIAQPFPTSYYEDLIDELSGTSLIPKNDIGGEVLKPVKARFQADTLIV